jgi:hypothetical protein
MDNAVTEAAKIHPFERAGLGQAPFRLVGVRDTAAGAGVDGLVRVGTTADGFDLLTTPGGTCAYCGTSIVVLCDVASADGQRFHVGTDCAEKACGPKLVAAVKSATLKLDRAKRQARAASKLETLNALLADEAVQAKLATLPHPTAWRAAAGGTLLDYAVWMSQAAGAAGIAKLLKLIKAS